MSRSNDSRNDALDSHRESAPLTSHSYDGIQEFDNPMPAWWRRVFWATFAFSLGYFAHFQLTGNGASVEQSYAEDMREFRELQAAQALGEKVTEEGLVRLMNDPVLMRDASSLSTYGFWSWKPSGSPDSSPASCSTKLPSSSRSSMR